VNPPDYIDLDDPNVAHSLADHNGEPNVNWASQGSELGFQARYVPYDNPDVGLSDGDEVGVTDDTSDVGSFPNGGKGYKISDVDGNFILEFDPVVSTSTGPSCHVSYFINKTGYEGNGTNNSTGSDRFRIFVKHLEENTEYDILDTTGFDINDLGIEGQWITGSVSLPDFNGTANTFQLVVEGRNNSASEAFYIDQVNFDLSLNLDQANQNTFSMFPNPAQNTLNIGAINEGQLRLTFFDILGKQVKKVTHNRGLLSIDDLKSGIYFVKIEQGKHSETKKLIIR